MGRQVLSANLKHSYIFNYLVEKGTCSSSKREKKNNPVIWLKPLAGRMRSSPTWLHQQPPASTHCGQGHPKMGSTSGGRGAAALAPGPSGESWPRWARELQVQRGHSSGLVGRPELAQQPGWCGAPADGVATPPSPVLGHPGHASSGTRCHRSCGLKTAWL